MGTNRPAIQRYAVAVLSVAAALLFTRLLWSLEPGLGPLFFGAVMVSAWYGGLGPGLLATALAGSATAFFFAGPAYSLAIGADDIIRITIFAIEAIVISSLQEASRRSFVRMQEARDVAEAANHAKDRFLSILSHELRMPLNPVLTAASALARDDALPPHVRDDMHMIRRNIELETRLIDDLLDLARLGRGKLHLEMKNLDAHDLLREALRICEADAVATVVQLELATDARHFAVRADPARLQQIFWNLIRNAVKFTPPGGTVTVRSRNDRPGELVIEVRDTGIGIPTAALHRIFDAFEQTSESVTRQYGGLGLGLAISKSLVELHGGTIEAASEGPGRGACFTVRFPALLSNAVAEDEVQPQSPGAATRRLRILLVEDHRDTRQLMVRLLASAHDVRPAGSVQEALDLAYAGAFDLVISDLGLPDGSGLDLMQTLRQQYQLPGIALTGYGGPDEVQRSRDAGFIGHLTKPVVIEMLEAAIAQVAAQAPIAAGTPKRSAPAGVPAA